MRFALNFACQNFSALTTSFQFFKKSDLTKSSPNLFGNFRNSIFTNSASFSKRPVSKLVPVVYLKKVRVQKFKKFKGEVDLSKLRPFLGAAAENIAGILGLGLGHCGGILIFPGTTHTFKLQTRKLFCQEARDTLVDFCDSSISHIFEFVPANSAVSGNIIGIGIYPSLPCFKIKIKGADTSSLLLHKNHGRKILIEDVIVIASSGTVPRHHVLKVQETNWFYMAEMEIEKTNWITLHSWTTKMAETLFQTMPEGHCLIEDRDGPRPSQQTALI